MEEVSTQHRLTKKEKRELGRQQRAEAEASDHLHNKKNKIKSWIFGIGVPVVILGGIVFLLSTAPEKLKLPPTIAQGHTEDMPGTHITDTPLPDSMQRHMLEHADGKNSPSIIIQYNCKKYSCDADLVSKLTELVKKYPNNVYLAPNSYDGKVILTKLNTIKILDTFDEEIIKGFIENT